MRTCGAAVTQRQGTALAKLGRMGELTLLARGARRPLPLLCTGRCEVLKASIHGVVLGTAALCALYNFAAWTVRRQRHLAVNTGLYTALAIWEWIHVQHHVDAIPAAVAVIADHIRESEESPAA
jgi:hypothetical protein